MLIDSNIFTTANSMEQSLSWAASSSSSCHVTHRVIWHPKGHCRGDKSAICPPSWVSSILPMPPLHLFNIHFNTVHLSLPRSSKWSLFLGSPHHKAVCTSPFICTCHMPRLSHSSWFVHVNNIYYAISFIPFLPPPSSFHISSSAPCAKTPLACVSPTVWDYQTISRIFSGYAGGWGVKRPECESDHSDIMQSLRMSGSIPPFNYMH